jgi:hypothetical protein
MPSQSWDTKFGADTRIRTETISLEGYSATIEHHTRINNIPKDKADLVSSEVPSLQEDYSSLSLTTQLY